ncbi:MAG TPA: DsbA family protein [Patescibacteria group bacterium]|nr:DsbA family protein [Patescibacteria group bacterium]
MSENSRDGRASIFERLVPVILIITVGLAFLVGVLWQKVENIGKGGTTGTGTDTTQKAPEQVKVSIDQIKGLFDKDVIKFGNKDSKLIFVEASDPSCPYCHVAAGLNSELNTQVGNQFKLVKDGGTYVAPVIEMKKLVDQGKASFVWLYFNGHGNGELATKALYCAYEKGKFWEAHDLLMTNKGYTFINDTVKNDKTKSGDMANFLKSAVDSAEMKKCLDSGKYDERLASDMALGTSLGVSGTPGFFVNETNFAGAYSFTDMESLVTSALE